MKRIFFNINQVIKYFDILKHCGIKTYFNVLKKVLV